MLNKWKFYNAQKNDMIVIYESKRYWGNFAALRSTWHKSTEFITYHFKYL